MAAPKGAKSIGKTNIKLVVKSPKANEINRNLSIAALYLKSDAIKKPITKTVVVDGIVLLSNPLERSSLTPKYVRHLKSYLKVGIITDRRQDCGARSHLALRHDPPYTKQERPQR